jgi:hypothetical protein
MVRQNNNEFAKVFSLIYEEKHTKIIVLVSLGSKYRVWRPFFFWQETSKINSLGNPLLTNAGNEKAVAPG